VRVLLCLAARASPLCLRLEHTSEVSSRGRTAVQGAGRRYAEVNCAESRALGTEVAVCQTRPPVHSVHDKTGETIPSLRVHDGGVRYVGRKLVVFC
jgi:hypothetical protein